MRRVKEFKVGDDRRVRQAIQHLRAARDLLKQSRCPKAASKTTLALSSALGAERNMGARKLYFDYPHLKR